jgi:hypothetical protein
MSGNNTTWLSICVVGPLKKGSFKVILNCEFIWGQENLFIFGKEKRLPRD